MRSFKPLTACLLLLLMSCNSKTENVATDQANALAKQEQTLQPLTAENAEEVLAAYGKENPDTIAVISTRHGDIKVRLYKDTPLHRANFVRLAKGGFYDQGEFYRVVKGLVIQGGDSDNRTMKQGPYKIPPEFNPKYFHKKGALAMARYGDDRNPDKKSSSHNFYIVQGKPREVDEIRAYEAQFGKKYTPEQVQIYTSIGGEPSLDYEYTVFGEVIEGLDVVDKIAEEPVDGKDWPKEVVPHKITIQ